LVWNKGDLVSRQDGARTIADHGGLLVSAQDPAALTPLRQAIRFRLTSADSPSG
jgi:50S ribosomal subunit-associated GTPase HflX